MLHRKDRRDAARDARASGLWASLAKAFDVLTAPLFQTTPIMSLRILETGQMCTSRFTEHNIVTEIHQFLIILPEHSRELAPDSSKITHGVPASAALSMAPAAASS